MRYVRRASLPVLMAMFLLGACANAASAMTHPFRGSVHWSIVLCKTSDIEGDVPHEPAYYRELFVNSKAGALARYYSAVSLGAVNFDGSVVKGWYTLPYTLEQEEARNAEEPHGSKPFGDCLQAARDAGYTAPSGQPVLVFTYPALKRFDPTGCCALVGADADFGSIAREVGRGLTLGDWTHIEGYDDPWDLMSWPNAWGAGPTHAGGAPPGLIAYQRDRMGWLPRDRITVFGADGSRDATITLAALGHIEIAGAFEVRVPFDPADPQHYYTLEYRSADSLDAGIPASTVLIHEIRRSSPNGPYLAYLLRQPSGLRAPVVSLVANGVSISVVSTSGPAAVVHVSGDDRCLQGYVWREATPADRVCVSPGTRAQARSDNAAAASRRAGGGAYGADTCVQGFVWREATPSDRTCVPVATRTQTREDNEVAATRSLPRSTFGPNTCAQGYVWREADASDWVCVTPETRLHVQTENALAASRRIGGYDGSDSCAVSYVWRDAFPADRVCVTPEERSQAHDDNAHAGDRLEQRDLR